MFAKPFNLILVYIVTVFNMTILACPLIALIIPFLDKSSLTINISNSLFIKIKLAIFIILFLVSFFMLCYFLLDLIFGFAVRSSLKNCKRFEKYKEYDFLSNIFEEVKEKFNEKTVKLYIKNSDEVNAYAVASFGRKAMVLTSGMINHYLNQSENPKEFLFSIRSIMGHEMSHLINKDFLPTYLIIANQRATNFVSSLLNIFFNFAARFSAMIPYGGRFGAELMFITYNILHFFFSFFNRFIVFTIYEFLRKFVSRSLEYRCDRQSARAFGGKNMAFALSFLGKSGYFTLFSTHPATQKRIKKVQKIELDDSIIRPNFADSFSNYLSMMFLLITSIVFAKKAGVDLLVRSYIRDHEAIHQQIRTLYNLIRGFIGV